MKTANETIEARDIEIADNRVTIDQLRDELGALERRRIRELEEAEEDKQECLRVLREEHEEKRLEWEGIHIFLSAFRSLFFKFPRITCDRTFDTRDFSYSLAPI